MAWQKHVFRIGMALQTIAMLVDDDTFHKIRPYMEEIEKRVIEIAEESEDK